MSKHKSHGHQNPKPTHHGPSSSPGGTSQVTHHPRSLRDRDREPWLARAGTLPDRRTLVMVAVPSLLVAIGGGYLAQSPIVVVLAIVALALTGLAGLTGWRRERVAATRDGALLRELEARGAEPYLVVLLVAISSARRAAATRALDDSTSPSARALDVITREVIASADPTLAALTVTPPTHTEPAEAVSRALDLIATRAATAATREVTADPGAGYRAPGAHTRAAADAHALLALAFAVRGPTPPASRPASRAELASLASAWLAPYPDAVVAHAVRIVPDDPEGGISLATLRARYPELQHG